MNLVISKKQKDTLFTNGVEIHIVGKPRLQNELLTLYLHQKLCDKCFVSETINNIPKKNKNSRLVLWDCQKKDLDEMIIELKKYHTPKKLNNYIVLFNVPADLKFQKKFISKGIHGFFYEHDLLENFIKGIQAILSGKLWFPREMMARCILEEPVNDSSVKNTVKKLTRRQIEILSMIAIGATNQDISKKLYISPHTVKNHLYNIFQKINVSNRIQASLWAAINL